MARRITSGGPRDPWQNNRARHVGTFYQRQTAHATYVSAWPRKRKYWKNPTNLAQRSVFQGMVDAIPNMDPTMIAAAHALADRTGYAWRDILALCYFGKYIEIQGPLAMPIQEDLDSITTVLGSLLVRDTSIWVGVPPGTPGQLLAISALGAPEYIDPPSAGAARGLFSDQLSALIPTSLGTGMTTWVNQGSATVSDQANGIGLVVDTGHTNMVMRTSSSVPSTPYTRTVLVMSEFSANDFSFFGWTDGTKFQGLAHFGLSALIRTDNWNAYNSFSGTSATRGVMAKTSMWMQIADDGTNITTRWSLDGESWIDSYTVAKASGFLGGSGYSHLAWGGRWGQGVLQKPVMLSFE